MGWSNKNFIYLFAKGIDFFLEEKLLVCKRNENKNFTIRVKVMELNQWVKTLRSTF